MKPSPECFICLLERGLKQIRELVGVSDEQAEIVLKEIAKMLVEEFGGDTTPAWLGTLRERIIQRVLGVSDYFKTVKERSDEVARKVWKLFEAEINFQDYSYETFRKLVVLATAGNAIEFHIREYEFKIEEFPNLVKEAEKDIVIDETRELWEEVKKAKTILYALDNHGEAIFDLQLVRFLSGMGKKLFIAARGVPVLNDVTVEEAEALGFEKYGKVVSNGDWIGLDPRREDNPKELLDAYRASDLIIAKGMGNYESLSGGRLDKTTFVLLKAKCLPIARNLGVPLGKLVIKRLF